MKTSYSQKIQALDSLEEMERWMKYVEDRCRALEQLLGKLSDASKRPLDDMDKYECWPPGQELAYDHTPYYYLRCLITEAERMLNSPIKLT